MAFEETKVKAKSFAKKLAWMTVVGLILFSTVYYFYRTYTIEEAQGQAFYLRFQKKARSSKPTKVNYN
ncbi:MAG: hypothetical protein IPO26_07515 [Saprospiraceae bacterium]|nr:hypothetical protein [Saprospiraceae bacterium]